MRSAGSFGYLMKTEETRKIEDAESLTRMKLKRLVIESRTANEAPWWQRLHEIGKSYRGELYLLSAAIVYGTTICFMKQSTISALAFSAMRQCFSFLVCLFLVPFIRWTDAVSEETEESQYLDNSTSVWDRRRNLIYYSAIIAIGSTGGNVFQQIGLLGDSAGKTGFLGSFQVVFTPILDAILLGSAISKPDIYAALLSLLGVFIMSGYSAGSGGLSVSDLSLLASAAFYSINITYGDRGAHLLNTLDLSLGDFAFSSIFGVAVCFASAGWHHAVGEKDSSDVDDLFLSPAARAELPLAVGTAISQALAVILAKLGFMSVPSSRASLIIATNSVVAAVAGYAILGEAMQVHEVVGSAVMLAASVISISDLGVDSPEPRVRSVTGAGNLRPRRSTVVVVGTGAEVELAGQYGSVATA